MSELYDRIQELCKEAGITVTKLCRDTGISRSTLSELNKGRTKSLSSKVSYKIADYFHVPLEYINENCVSVNPLDVLAFKDKIVLESNTEDDKPADTLTVLPTEKIHMIPVFGSVAAGFGAYASSDIIEYIPLYIENDCDVEDTICITVKGQSMYPKIEEGDRIIVRRQDSVDNGRIAVVMIGDEAVVKRVECEKNKLTLISINPEYPPRVIEGKDLEDVRIVGLVQEVMKKL